MELENTIRHIAQCVVQELQDKGLLLTQAQMEEYRELKANATDCMMTGTQVSILLGTSKATITELRKAGKIKAQFIGKRWKYKKSEIEKYAKRNQC
jgi:excisionase family DNA binding protein